MSFIQRATNNYFGFAPVVNTGVMNAQVGSYLVSSSEGTAINTGDVIVQTSKNTVRAVSSAGGLTNFTSSMAYVGVAAMALGANAGSTAALVASLSTQLLQVYDDPYQVFAVCDTTSGLVTGPDGLYKNYALLTTGAGGSTGPNTKLNRSVMAISGLTATAAGVFHLVGLHPIEADGFSTAGGGTGASTDVRKWMGRFVSGVNVVPSTTLLTIANTTS